MNILPTKLCHSVPTPASNHRITPCPSSPLHVLMSNYPTEDEELSLELLEYYPIPYADSCFREYFKGYTRKQEIFERTMFQCITRHNAHRKVLQDENTRSSRDEPLAMWQMDHDIQEAVSSAQRNRLKKELGTMEQRDANRKREEEESIAQNNEDWLLYERMQLAAGEIP